MYDISNGIAALDLHLRPSVEALVIHVLYCDLWDVDTDDPVAWSRQTFKNIVSFVERDRQAIASQANRAVCEL